jgi:hypothetical protein
MEGAYYYQWGIPQDPEVLPSLPVEEGEEFRYLTRFAFGPGDVHP